MDTLTLLEARITAVENFCKNLLSGTVTLKPAEPPAPEEPPRAQCYTRVHPTGSHAHGVFRDYPDVIPYNGVSSTGDMNLWSYVRRLSGITNPATGQPFFPVGRLGAIGYLLHDDGVTVWPVIFDMYLHGQDWWTEEQWMKYELKLASQMGNPDQWISKQPPVAPVVDPAPTPVPPGETPL